MEYKEFLNLRDELRSGDHKQFKAIFEENSSYCIRKLLSNFKCSREDAEDIYIDSVMNFRDKVISGKLEVLTDLRSYLYATCKNMLLVKFKKEKRTDNAIFEINAGNAYYEIDQENHSEYRDKILKITEESLKALSEKCHELLKFFYFDKLDLEQIALKMGFANGNVAKVSKARCFQKLVDEVRMRELQKTNANAVRR